MDKEEYGKKALEQIRDWVVSEQERLRKVLKQEKIVIGKEEEIAYRAKVGILEELETKIVSLIEGFKYIEG